MPSTYFNKEYIIVATIMITDFSVYYATHGLYQSTSILSNFAIKLHPQLKLWKALTIIYANCFVVRLLSHFWITMNTAGNSRTLFLGYHLRSVSFCTGVYARRPWFIYQYCPSLIPRTFVESAQNLDYGEISGWVSKVYNNDNERWL